MKWIAALSNEAAIFVSKINEMTVEETNKDVLRELIAEYNEIFEPLVIVAPEDVVPSIEECIPEKSLIIDLKATQAGDIIGYINQIQSCEYPIVFFKNVDSIRSRKDREDWKKLIMCGLKSENKTFIFDDVNAPCGLADYYVQFSKIWVICTCTKYPEYLRR